MEEKYDIIYCPFIEVEIANIGSEILENIGSFPIFVLSELRNGNSILRIAEGVCLDIMTVTNVADELGKNNLVTKNGNTYSLTDLGHQYLRIHEFIKKFRKNSGHRFAVNCFTCQLEKVIDERYYLQTDEKKYRELPHLPNKLKGSEQLIRTPNYENVKEYMKPYLNFSSIALTEDDYEYVQFELRAEIKNQNRFTIFYVPYEIPPKSYLWDSNVNNPEYKFWAEIPIQSGKRRFYSSDLYTLPSGTEISDSLIKLNKLAPEFVSKLGETVVENLIKADEWSRQSLPIYVDCYSGNKFEGGLTEIKHGKTIICLSERMNLPKSFIQLKDIQGIIYNYIDTRLTYIPVQIDFKLLIQKRGEK